MNEQRSQSLLDSNPRTRAPLGTIAVVNAFKTYTGSTLAAKAYYQAFQRLGLAPRWYQCVSSRREADWDLWGGVVRGPAPFRDDLNLVLDSLFVFPRKLEKVPGDMVFLTDPILLAAAPRLRRSIVLVHDMREFDSHRRSWAATRVYRRLFRHISHVERILCVSDATRERLVALTHPSAPIEVIHHCSQVRGDAGKHIERSLRRIQERREIRVLYLAADRPYKNVPFYLSLAQAMRSDIGGYRFEFYLITRLRATNRRLVNQLHLPNLHVVPEVNALERPYDETDLLVHPSSEEGYGLPLVEAMQFGLPILASNIPAVQETLGEAGTTLPVENVSRWVSELGRLTEPSYFERLARTSAARGKEFTPERFLERVREAVARW